MTFSIDKGTSVGYRLVRHMVLPGLLLFPIFTLPQHMQAQTFDIVSFGARCNGGDDSGPVQAAINALPNGGTLLVSCQAGIGSRGLTLQNKQNATIKGINGGGFKALSPSTNNIAGISWGSIVRVLNCSGCAVRNLVFQINNQPVAAVGLNYNTGAIVDGNKIYNIGNGIKDGSGHLGPSAAIQAALNTRNQYTNNLVQHTAGWYGGSGSGQSDGPRGMWIGNNGAVEISPLIANNTIIDAFHTGLATHTDNATITGNRVYDAGTTGAHQKSGGACLKETHAASSQTVISNNDFEFCGQGIQLESTENITIQGNKIHGMVDSGVYGLASNVKVIGNTFWDNKAAGITFLTGQNWLIQSNVFDTGLVPQGTGTRLISMSGTMQNVQVLNNTIKDNVYGGVQLYDRGGKISGVTIAGNTITRGHSYGILINETSSGAISNVSIHNNCFCANGGGPLRDMRSGGRALSAPVSASSCP